MIRNSIESPSAELRRKFSIICGEKTTTQQAMLIEPQIPLIASMSKSYPLDGGNMLMSAFNDLGQLELWFRPDLGYQVQYFRF